MKRYRGVARITFHKSRKGFAVKLNPHAHWSSAFYKGLDHIQLKDGREKVLLNRDDQAGFWLDTTFTHRHGKCITEESMPALTTRTDFVNSYSSLLQTTSYLFMETDTTEKMCVAVVKPHFNFPKSPTQHYIDLEMLDEKLPVHFDQKPVDCIRVDGATDEGPGHLEVLWTERHLDIATDVYIDSINGAACCGTTLQLHKGGENEDATERRESLLVFLKGKAEEKMKLKESKPELFKFFEKVCMVRSNHMNKELPSNYVFMLNLCNQPNFPHPLCKSDTVPRDLKWFENGPPLQTLPIPIPDPNRPWGGNCKDCTTVCSGHYLKPQECEEFVRENG